MEGVDEVISDDPICTNCDKPRSDHSEEPPYDTDECKGFSYLPKKPLVVFCDPAEVDQG